MKGAGDEHSIQRTHFSRGRDIEALEQAPSDTGSSRSQRPQKWQSQTKRVPRSKKKRCRCCSCGCSCCKKCCSKFLHILAHNTIYGSFLGPNPVAFVCCCVPCRTQCDQQCIAPFCVASIVTKLQNFVMLGIITVFACIFIFPLWPKIANSSFTDFGPCSGNKLKDMEEANGGCISYAGYYLVYRIFLALATFMLTWSFFMIFATSTDEDHCRSKLNHGFWLYKYLYLTALLIAYFLVCDGKVDKEGFFEYTTSMIGNVAHFIFSLVELTVVMDIAEAWVVQNKTSSSSWSFPMYWIVTSIFFMIDVVCLGFIIFNFAFVRKFDDSNANSTNLLAKYNCEEGSRGLPDWFHFGLILGIIGLIMLSMLVMCCKAKFQKRFPYVGWFQLSILTGFVLFYLWSALYSSPNTKSRPRCNWALKYVKNNEVHIRPGSRDVYLRTSGLMHGFLCVFTLMYYSFVHGPRTKTAPFSILFRHIWGNENRIPLIPDLTTGPEEFRNAVKNYIVWDDETEEVSYSWSKFYLMMVLGALSLMMAMTNFTNPWATDRFNSSGPALGFKYSTAVTSIAFYMGLLVLPCSRIHPGYNSRKMKKRGKGSLDGSDEDALSTDAAEGEDEEDDEEEEEVKKEETVEVKPVVQMPVPEIKPKDQEIEQKPPEQKPSEQNIKHKNKRKSESDEVNPKNCGCLL